MDIKPYKKEFDYSYCLGAFPTFEMLKNRGSHAKEVIVSPQLNDRTEIDGICKELGIPVRESGKLCERLGEKENVFIIGVFEKFTNTLDKNRPHIVLVNPGNMGNMGTIIRSAVGFGIKDIAVIRPGADIFNPKTVRASMGAVFRVNFSYYDDFGDYLKEFPGHEIFPFMLDGAKELRAGMAHKDTYSLVFGNESSGLPHEFAGYGQSVLIPQSEEVDSLNITIAAAVAMYVFNGDKMRHE